MKRFFFTLFAVSLFGQSPEEIQEQLNAAEAKYAKAKSMFNPWYTGPLITPPASLIPPGMGNVQPYLFVSGVYEEFDTKRHRRSIEHNIYSTKISVINIVGVTNTLQFTLVNTASMNWQDHHDGGGYGDTIASLTFPIAIETLYAPNMSFTISETFPTGKYKNLSLNGLGLNSTGEGSYQTQFGVAASKIIWWSYPHPMKFRLFGSYTVALPVHVTNFNNYGGGFGTNGHVKPGNTWTGDLGWELSLTQNWVFALDVAYVAQSHTPFTGTPGVLADGTPATVGGGYNDNLSLAPAIEYNWNVNLGILWGVQFSVYGKNSQNLINGQFSVTYTW